MNPASAKSPIRVALAAGLFGLFGFASGSAEAAVRIKDQVQADGCPVANSTIILWAGSTREPRQLAQAEPREDGSFALTADETPSPGASFYLVARGGMVLGGEPPADVTIKQMTTVASVWTN
jgi:hypothetical protein